MKRLLIKRAALGAAVLMGMAGVASAAPLLEPGYAVHTFGISPDANDLTNPDGNATVRIYDTTGRKYSTDTSGDGNSERPTSHLIINDGEKWTINTIGNVYGIAIDQDRNIYVSASANWSPGYLGEGHSGNSSVPVRYGNIGGGENNISAAGTVYEIDKETGDPIPFAVLPQSVATFTHQVCGRPDNNITRTTGVGLGNIAYDKFHHQFFVSNFSDGKIYRVDSDGNVNSNNDALDTSSVTGFDGVLNRGSAYGLAVSPKGDKLFFGTIEIQNNPYNPRIFSVELDLNGGFKVNTLMQHTKLDNQSGLKYTQNIGGAGIDDGVWAAFSDLTFTPNGELMAGVRVGCYNNFATSYNHGGIVYLLKENPNDGNRFNLPSNKTTPSADQNTTYEGDPVGTNSPEQRTGYKNGQWRFDAGSIPLRFYKDGENTQNMLNYGPDDGYGGVAVWQKAYDSFDLYATSSDINSLNGLHGFMQFNGDFNITEHAALEKAVAFGSVNSSTTATNNEDSRYDYKGIGGDVEVLSVAPVSIGSYVWYDKDEDGIQDSGEECINGAMMTLQQKDSTGNFVAAKNINGGNVPAQQTTTHNGQCGTYMFDNLPEGDYRVCVAPPAATGLEYVKTNNQVATDNNDAANDTNIATTAGNTHCSGTYSLYLNVEPTEAGGYAGDNQDDAREKWGNMTVDFGFIKHEFDLALVKKIQGSASKKYNAGDTVKFTITVYNQGTVEAKNVKVMDYIPSGLILNDNRWTKSGDKAVLNTAIPSIAAGSSKDVEIEFKIDPNLQSESDIVNVAEIKSATNDFNLLDKDSTPDDKACYTDLANDNDTADTHGCDDLDPAVVHIQHHNISPDTDTPGGGGDEADPDCDCTDGNAADAMSSFALLLMLLGTLAVAMRFLPRDEQQAA